MTPGKLRKDVVADRAAWVREMVAGLGDLPLESLEEFEADPRTAAAAESYLRRALEALLDLGRHILAKAFGRAPAQYKEIADLLVAENVLDSSHGGLIREMAGYRNRLVHFYDEISRDELYQICKHRRGELDAVLDQLLAWIGTQATDDDR